MKKTKKKGEIASYVLVLDSEQADLIAAATDVMHAAMDARAKRIDPDGIVSMTCAMSRNKCKSIVSQYELGPLMPFSAFDIERRNNMRELMGKLLEETDFALQDALFQALRTLSLHRDRPEQLPWERTVENSTDL